jgi:YesN/AraC family two-component response regulator
MRPPTALVVYGERELRADLRGALSRLWPELQVLEARDGKEALELFETHHPDAVFLDVQMPGMTGLSLAERLSGRCHLVFVSAYEDYALDAFEHAGVDYLLKPVEDERLKEAVERLRGRLSLPPGDLR